MLCERVHVQESSRAVARECGSYRFERCQKT